jgi:hypothetical protein
MLRNEYLSGTSGCGLKKQWLFKLKMRQIKVG